MKRSLRTRPLPTGSKKTVGIPSGKPSGRLPRLAKVTPRTTATPETVVPTATTTTATTPSPKVSVDSSRPEERKHCVETQKKAVVVRCFDFEAKIIELMDKGEYTSCYLELSALLGDRKAKEPLYEAVLLAYRAKCSYALLNLVECYEDGSKSLHDGLVDREGPERCVSVEDTVTVSLFASIIREEYKVSEELIEAFLQKSVEGKSDRLCAFLSEVKGSIESLKAFRSAVETEEWEYALSLLPLITAITKDTPLIILRATVLLENGRAEEARSILLPYVPSISPPPVLQQRTPHPEEYQLRRNVDAHYLLANVLLAKASLYCGRSYVNIAAELIQRCLTVLPNYLPAMKVGNYIVSLEDYASLYTRAMEDKKYHLALDICEDALALDVKNSKLNATVYHERALVYHQLGKPLSVIEDCTRSIREDPSVAKVYVTRATALDEVQRTEDANLDRLMAVKLNKSYERVFNHVAPESKPKSPPPEPTKFPWQLSLYDDLGLSPSASLEDIKTAYRRIVLKVHPDKLSNEPKAVQKTAEEKFKKVTHAYFILSDPYRRSAYDLTLPESN